MKRKISLLPFIFFVFLFALLNWYVTSGLMILFPTTIFQEIFFFLNLILAVTLIAAILRMQSHGMDGFFKFATHSFIAIFMAEIAATLVLFVGDIVRLILSFLGNHTGQL